MLPDLRDFTVLGIETSCDETAASVVRSGNGSGTGSRILSNVIRSQIDEHTEFGGVVPEIAARAHIAVLDRIVAEAMAEAGVSFDEIDAVAATAGPGLIGGVIVGLMTAKAIAMAAGKPLLAINHLEGHALTARLTDDLAFPYLLLLVSGGHTQFLLVKGVGDYERLGSTIDDAIGEAFDKTAKLLGLPYPGGPAVERMAREGDPKRFALPRPLLDRPGLDMSFAGLKTALRNAAEKAQPVDEQTARDLCAGFQRAVSDVLAHRTRAALSLFAERFPDAEKVIVVAGGVAANSEIRAALDDACRTAGARFVAPPHRLCTDNAAMIAWAGIERLDIAARAGEILDDQSVAPRPRWPLDETSASLLGAGKKGAKV
ncbi:tRNA (adenosine(37)-N6)-threonylcarbamoyltransferase complex transferase subunit TsaD [Pannonibacter sp. SL95]|jgi:N6-L-threonylcarbamoyladenine synthase|uniref:tRNA (adenosine(37)-N6)-threonylcarbamoyltransferase complex transferase subunit TsaD n=1 Tax=Pannonibacter sp. SL95 TaxID=2995153 RepID=UPI002275668F|nr:tRNA (adenosine(37)-N6)-threonylcarbamoyltransferase complex transferase subunit TsaD [Pannonibacter sp. SL95]MCY1706486.1 tRNA (adenosine(37)-N6)-threonylcarbamoyltransferase complex transferase subunit TsaD [Pannonibacter sp. SL95]